MVSKNLLLKPTKQLMLVAVVKEASRTVGFKEGPSLAFFVGLATSLAFLCRCDIGRLWILEKVCYVRIEGALLKAEATTWKCFGSTFSDLMKNSDSFFCFLLQVHLFSPVFDSVSL